MMRCTILFILTLELLTFHLLVAQDLDPRAYSRIPANTTTLIAGYSYAFGDVVTDPTLPFKDIKATVQTTSLGVARSFGFFKLTSQGMIALPYSWAKVTGQVGNQAQQAT